MKDLIKKIKFKADNINTNIQENRRIKGAYIDCLMMVKEYRGELLVSFFLWFRENGERYLDQSIERMIEIYEKESDNIII